MLGPLSLGYSWRSTCSWLDLGSFWPHQRAGRSLPLASLHTHAAGCHVTQSDLIGQLTHVRAGFGALRFQARHKLAVPAVVLTTGE